MTFVMQEEPQPDDENQEQAMPVEPGAFEEESASPPTPPSTPAVPAEAATPPPSQAIPPVPPPQASQQAQKKGGCRGCGCAVTVLTILAVLVLVIVALLLPPFSLLDQFMGPQYVTLDPATPGVSHPDGLTLTIDTANPGEGFGVALDTVDPASFTNGTAQQEWAAAAQSALPPALIPISPIYSVQYTGTAPGAIALRITTPAGTTPTETVDLYAYNEATGAWEFVPSQFAEGDTAVVTDMATIPAHIGMFQTSSPAPQLVVPVDVSQSISPEIAQVSSMVMPAGLQPTMQGTLQGSLAANFQTGAGYAVSLLLRNYSSPNALDTATVEAILSNDSVIAEHVRQIAACGESCYQGTPVDGITIDYQGIDPAYRDQFSIFIRELARTLHTNGRSLTVVLPAAVEGAVGEPWDTGAYNWRKIGQYADYVQVNLGENPMDYIPGGLVERMLRWGTGEISRYKLIPGISAHSTQQVGADMADFAPISYQEAVAGLGNVEITTESEQHYFAPGTTIEATLNGTPATTGFEETAQTPYIEYEGGSRIWLTTRSALLYRLNAGKTFNIGAVALLDLLDNTVPADTIQAAADYTLNVPAATGTGTELALNWTVIGSSGAVVNEQTTGLDEGFTWDAVDEDGNYAINVAVISGDLESERAGQQVAVANATSTPTPTPSPTPTPTVTPTPRPVVVQQPAAPAPAAEQPAAEEAAAAPAPAPVVSGSITGGFEFGGHVADFNSAIPYMQQAGMKWVKVQVRSNFGDDCGGQAGIINAAHGAGFKILLGSVGNKDQLGSMDKGQYFADFARYNACLASLGADAIEVWNEMNIDREWPQGQIDPNLYTQMLAASYNAIKGANGGTMVISGALAPTGAEGAFGVDRVWNDDRYTAGMAAAGAANYMDCIGAHYNEGIVPPDQVGGDPRGGFPSYYLTTMIDRAWGPFGGARPLCFTELGYVSPEGYGALPAGFEWGQNVTVAQQAAWLANAAVINSNSGKVRLMIIWNVNFTNFAGDPMAGFAIVRPGGGCPACDTLRSVAG